MIKKILKIFGFTLLFLIILIILLPVIFKGVIIEKVKEEANNNLNAKVDFGEFDLGLISTFPNFEFSIDDVKIDGVDQFEGTQLASIDNLTLKVDLMSVISGDEIKVKTISILNPTINAVVLADSTANWDIAKASNEEKVVDATTEEASSFKLGLRDFSITNANITYNDATMDLSTTITNFNFSLSGDMTEDVTDLVTKTSIEALNLEMESIKYFKNATIDIDATIKADLANSKYTFTENEFKINELTLFLDGWLAMFEDKDDIDMDLKFGAKKTEFKSILSLVPAVFMTEFASVKTAGKVQLEGYAKGIYTETTLPAFGLDLIVADAMFKYPDLPKAVNNIQVDLHVENPGGTEDNTLINLRRFYMEMAGNPIDMNLIIKTPISDPDIEMGIKAKMNLATIKDVMPTEGDELIGSITADVVLAGKVSALEEERYDDFIAKGQLIILNMDYKSDSLPYDIMLKQMYLNFSPQFVELAAFEAQIGKSDMNANGKMENFIAYAFADDEALKGRFNLSSNLMDLNEFMSEDTESSNTELVEANEEPLSVIEVPKNIDFVLASSMNKVIYDNMEINNLNGELIVRNQKVSMNNLGMNLLGGSMLMNGYYETTNPKKPGISYDMDINNFDIEKVNTTFSMIEEMAPYAKNMKGRFNTSINLVGVLDEEMMPDLNTLTGGGNMQTKNMRVTDFKALNKLSEVLKNDKFKSLDINDTEVKYSFKEGRVYTEPFDIKMGPITGTMSGSNGFDQTMDNKMTLKVPSSELGAGDAVSKLNSQASSLGMSLKAAEFVNVDVLIKGTVDDPKVSVNLKGAVGNIVDDLKEQIKEQVKEKIEDVKDDAKEKAREQAGKLLAEAKKAAEKVRAEGKKAGDKIRAEGEKQKEKLIKDAGGNFLKKKAAQVAGKKVVKQANKQALKVETEANKKAEDMEAKAQKEANAIMAKVDSK